MAFTAGEGVGCVLWHQAGPAPILAPLHTFCAILVWGVNLKNIHNLKVELSFIPQVFFGLQAWEAASQVTLRELL